jgi:hypothetical protein
LKISKRKKEEKKNGKPHAITVVRFSPSLQLEQKKEVIKIYVRELGLIGVYLLIIFG